MLGPEHRDTIFSEARLAYVLVRSPAHRDESLTLGKRAAATASRVLGPDHFVTYITLDALGYIHRVAW